MVSNYELWQLEKYGNVLSQTPLEEDQEDNRLLEQLEQYNELQLNPE